MSLHFGDVSRQKRKRRKLGKKKIISTLAYINVWISEPDINALCLLKHSLDIRAIFFERFVRRNQKGKCFDIDTKSENSLETVLNFNFFLCVFCVSASLVVTLCVVIEMSKMIFILFVLFSCSSFSFGRCSCALSQKYNLNEMLIFFL